MKDQAYGGHLIISGSGSKTWTEGAARTVTGNLTVEDGATLSVAGAFAWTVSGTTTIGEGTNGTLATLEITNATGTKTFTGAVTINNDGYFNESAAAQLAFGGNVTINTSGTTVGGSTLTENGAAVVGIAGSLLNNGTYTASTGVHTFSGTTQTIGGTTTNTIPSVTISGTTTNNGTLTVSTALAGASTLTNSSTGTLNIGGTCLVNTLTASAAGNTVNYDGAGPQTVKATTYVNLTLAGSGAKTTTGVTVNGILDMAGSGTVSASAVPTYGTSATLQYDESVTAGLEWPTTFSSTGGVIIHSGTVNINNVQKIISNTLEIITGAVLNLGTNTTSTAHSLILGGVGQTATGSWGGTGSGATNINTTYFAAVAGRITTASTATITSATTGNWSASTTWTGGIIPGAQDAVVIVQGHTVTVNTTSAVCKTLGLIPTLAGTATLTFAASGSPKLTVSGAVTVGSTGNANRVGTITFTNGSTLEAGSLVHGAIANQISTITMTSGSTLKVNGAITTSGSGAVWTPSTGTVELTANNTLPATIFTSFGNLTISGGTTTTGAALTVGSLSINGGTLNTTSTTAFTVNGTTTIASGLLNVPVSAGNKTFTGLVTLNGGTMTGASTTVVLGGGVTNNSGTVTLTGTATMATAGATLSGTNAIATLTVTSPGTVTNSGALTVATALSGTGTFTNGNGTSGTLNIGGTSGITTLTASAANNTVNFTGTTQTIPALTYYNLNLSGSTTPVLVNGGTITIAGTFTPGSVIPTVTNNTVAFTGTTQTIPAFTYNNLTLSGSTTPVLVNGGTITIAGAFTPGSVVPTVTNNTVAFTGTSQTIPAFTYNNLNISGSTTPAALSGIYTIAGTFTPKSATVPAQGSSTLAFTGTSQTIPAFTYNNLTISGSTTPVLVNGGTITITGAFTPGSVVPTVTNNTVAFTGTSQTIPAFTYNNLNLSGSTTPVALSGSYTIASTFTPKSTTSPAQGTSTMTFTGTSQTIPAFTYYNLTLSGAGSWTAGGGLTLTNALTNGGTLDLAANALSAGSYSNSGTIKFSGATNGQVIGTGTVQYYGSTAQTVATGTYSTLKISNTTSASIGAATTAATLTIDGSSILNVNAGKPLTVSTTFTNGGTLNLLSDDANGTATILTPTSIGGSGTANVQQYLTNSRNWYISSPVTAATTVALNAPTVITYTEPTATWDVVSSGTALIPMKGYGAVPPTSTGAVTFTGTLNNGDKSISLTRTTGKAKEGFNLVGNPYPSYLDWSQASAANSGVLTTMWYRTKTGAGAYTFDTYNATGNTHTSNGVSTVSNLIPPMQAFWVRVNVGQTSPTLSFTNAMRSHNDVSTNKFKAPSAIQSVQKLLRLKVSNGVNSDEAIILFNQNASDGLDTYDSPKWSNANPVVPEIYTLAGTENVVINGFNKVNYNTEIPLGFTTGQSNTFTIKATEISNFDDGTVVILKDNLLNTEQELTLDNSYSFTSGIFSAANRFSIVFKTSSITTDINDINSQNISINKNKNNQIVVNCVSGLTDQSFVTIYDVDGKLLVTKNLTSGNTVFNTPINAGVCLVKVVNAGKCITKKLIFN